MSNNTSPNASNVLQPNAHPFEHVAALPEGEDFALLFSSRATAHSGRQSLLAHGKAYESIGSCFESLAQSYTRHPHLPWFGFLGYGMRFDTEKLNPDQTPAFISLPDYWMFSPRQMELWGHETTSSTDTPAPWREYAVPRISSLHSNFSKTQYLQAVEETIEQIHNGQFYQANITRKFYGTFEQAPNPLALFATLCRISPAPYSALIRCGSTFILSSSPESFVKLDAQGVITTRPIKGSAPRGATPEKDAKIMQTLKESPKDHAENLMIVDLMRHDLSHVARTGSVEVTKLYELESYATIHQLVSTITAQKRADASTLDVLKACFPPGSMTGAPKIRAMNWCTAQEKMARGVYSGAIGWIDADGACDFSVVIRTLIVDGDRFEFQVGGGIVADSNPHSEWQETLTKASGIAQTLCISHAELEHL